MKTGQKNKLKHKVVNNRFSWLSRLSALLLLVILLSQPVSPLFASELSVDDSLMPSDASNIEVATTEVIDVESESEPDVQIVEEVVIDEAEIPIENTQPDNNQGTTENFDGTETTETTDVTEPTEVTQSSDTENVVSSNTTDDSSDTSESDSEDESVVASSTEFGEDTTETTDEEDQSQETVTEDILPVVDETLPEVTEEIVVPTEESSTTLEIVSPSDELTTATSTVISGEIPPPSETIFYGTIVNDSNRYSFSVDECVPMGTETFFCSKQTTNSSNAEVTGVLSMPSSQGNKEIFIVTDATNVQVTDNLYDDEAPYYDAVSNTIVWHRSIDGRYQIVELDMDDNEERLITNADYNNMYPSRYGDATVWQGWVGENWEIFLEESGDTSMITENTTQDIAPRVNDNYVIWQAFEDGVWKVKVYDRISKHTETVADADGTSAQNPRFVLVYDAKHENGDVETRGYDLAERTNVPLSSVPAPFPKDLPAPEQTGEERALVNQTPQVKNKFETTPDNNNDPNPNASSTDSTVVDENVLVIPPYEASTTPETLIDESDTALSTTTDEVVLPETVIGTSTPSEVVEPLISELNQFDIVVTPFVPLNPEPTEESL